MKPLLAALMMGAAALPAVSAVPAPALAPAPTASAPSATVAAAAGPVIDDSWVRVGVVAAAASGLEGDRPLRYAFRDGERLEQMLASVGQIEADNLFLIKARNQTEFKASLGRIGARIAALKAQGRKVFLQFYYSGHGGARKFHLSDGALSFDEVKAALGGDRADARVYVLDVCFGASFFNAKGFRTAPPVQLQMEMDQAARGEVTISSSSVDEQAYEVKTLGGSIFTSHWIMALRGAGDRNRDGQVTLFEAYNYAYDRTSGYSAETLDRPQHPSFQMDLTGARDMTLARLLRSSTGILFQGCPAGLYNVVDLQRGIQIGELRIPQGEEFTLALEPGRYRVQYQPGRGPSQAADLELVNANMARLPFAAFQVQPTQVGLAKGGEDPNDNLPYDSGTDDDGLDGAGPRQPEVAATGPALSPMRPARFFGRLGFGAWGGSAEFWDPSLEKTMRADNALDRNFGTTGMFLIPTVKNEWGFELGYAISGQWYGGLRAGFGSSVYKLSATGREPLASLSDAERAKYPVNLEWEYTFTDARFGTFLGRGLPLSHGHELFADLGIALLARSADGERSLRRTLYQQTTRANSSASGEGTRLEGGLGYRYALPFLTLGKPLAIGLRIAPYYTNIRGFHDDAGDINLNADEYGCATLLTIGILGRTAFPRKTHPGRMP